MRRPEVLQAPVVLGDSAKARQRRPLAPTCSSRSSSRENRPPFEAQAALKEAWTRLEAFQGELETREGRLLKQELRAADTCRQQEEREQDLEVLEMRLKEREEVVSKKERAAMELSKCQELAAQRLDERAAELNRRAADLDQRSLQLQEREAELLAREEALAAKQRLKDEEGARALVSTSGPQVFEQPQDRAQASNAEILLSTRCDASEAQGSSDAAPPAQCSPPCWPQRRSLASFLPRPLQLCLSPMRATSCTRDAAVHTEGEAQALADLTFECKALSLAGASGAASQKAEERLCHVGQPSQDTEQERHPSSCVGLIGPGEELTLAEGAVLKLLQEAPLKELPSCGEPALQVPTLGPSRRRLTSRKQIRGTASLSGSSGVAADFAAHPCFLASP